MTADETAAPEQAAAPQETAAAASLPDLRLGSDIAQEATAAVEADRAGREESDAADRAALQAAAADEMTAEAMRAAVADPLPPPFAAALAEASPGPHMSVLGAAWKSYQECRAPAKEDIDALLDEWLGDSRKTVYGPLKAWLDAGLTGMAAPAYVA